MYSPPGASSMSHLFSALQIGSLHLDNRIIIAPMCQYSAHNGNATDWHRIHLGTLACSGAGLLIIEATAVCPEGRISPYDLGLYSDENENSLRQVLQSVRKYSNMPIAIQLAHAGRKGSTRAPWEGGSQLAPTEKNGWQTVAPSAIPYAQNEHAPLELSAQDFQRLKQDFMKAAERAVRIGIDAIELHAAHGYLLHEILSPLSNQRTDQYGGSLENRMRFSLEVFESIKQVVPAGYPVWVRISATDWVENGWDLESSIQFAKELKKRGCAALHVSTGGLSPNQKIPIAPGYQVPFAEKIKTQADIPTIAVGLITDPQQAESILSENKADAVALARSILYNPRWPWHAAAQLGASIKAPAQYWRSQPESHPKLFTKESFKK